MSAVFCCKLSIKERASVPGEGRHVNTTVFLGSSAHLMKSSREKPHVRSATDASTTFGSGILARSAKLWHNAQYLQDKTFQIGRESWVLLLLLPKKYYCEVLISLARGYSKTFYCFRINTYSLTLHDQ